MWKHLLPLVGGMMFLAVARAGDGAPEAPPEAMVAETAPASPEESHSPVVLCRAGDVDESLMERLKKWAEGELAIPVPLSESLALESDRLEDVVPVAAERLDADSLGMVVLHGGAGADEPHGIYRPESRVVVINVTDMREGADEEKLARRLERQVIRGIGVLMGLGWSPNPDSAMAEYRTLEELDRLARNLDPPWLVKFQERARALGIPLDPDNPMNLFRE